MSIYDIYTKRRDEFKEKYHLFKEVRTTEGNITLIEKDAYVIPAKDLESHLTQTVERVLGELDAENEKMKLVSLVNQTYGVGDITLKLAVMHPELRNSDQARAGFNICLDIIHRRLSDTLSLIKEEGDKQKGV